jgi:predicted TIM-barrel fold metal-dependent hydrolase
MSIFANHAHVFPESVHPPGAIDRLLQLMDACEIDRAVCFAPFAHVVGKHGIDHNSWLADELKHRSDRLIGFGTIDFKRNDFEDQVKRCRALGFVGLKIHPNSQQVPILDPWLHRVCAEAEKQKLFITFHSGVHRSRLRDCRVIDFDELAWNFPKLKFSLEHVGGYHFFHEALAVLFNHLPTPWAPGEPHVFGGLTSIFSDKTNQFWKLNDEMLRTLIHQVGARQLIFGLDFPFNQEEETKLAIRVIREELGLSREDADLVLGGNLSRELKHE